MGKDTDIQWCEHTFNPWRGCVEVSPGCAHCYARDFAGRNPKTLGVWGKSGTRVVAAEAGWTEVLKWNREAKAAHERHRVFCASFADVFEAWDGPMVDAKGHSLSATNSLTDPMYAPLDMDGRNQYGAIRIDFIRNRLFRLIRDTRHLDWLLLTKRPYNVMPIIDGPAGKYVWRDGIPPNVWIGTTVEDREAKARIDMLRKIPAAIRFLSVEPLLEDLGELDLTGIHWVIAGSESGPRARPMDEGWVRLIRDQCQAAGVSFFYKQKTIEGHKVGLPELDGRQWMEFP
jgi:protein gp37